MTEIQKIQIQEMRSKGLKFADIASKLNLSINSVKSFCRRENIMPAKKNEAQTISASSTIRHSSCKHCGAELVNTQGHRQKIFCSAACQQLYWRAHPDLMKHRAVVTRKCPACGKAFSDYKGHNRKYCSHACYINYRYGGTARESE